MKIIADLSHSMPLSAPVVVTIGNFDGVHIGHQFVLNRIKEQTRALGGKSAVVTFANHPSAVLRPDKQVASISTMTHRTLLLERFGIDILVVLKFTYELSQQSPEVFLDNIRRALPFGHLVLGFDSTIGRDRQGNKERVQAYAGRNHVVVEYMEQYFLGEKAVSSSVIRKLITEGNLEAVRPLLGRDYSIVGEVFSGQGKSKIIGFPTADINVSGLCLPPPGVYAVDTVIAGSTHSVPAVANCSAPLLEVYFASGDVELQGKQVEVIFKRFIRGEKVFGSIEELKKQIRADIEIILF